MGRAPAMQAAIHLHFRAASWTHAHEVLTWGIRRARLILIHA
jgi:hypothetical protein